MTQEEITTDPSASLPDAPADTPDAQEQPPETVSMADYETLKAENDKLSRTVSSQSGRASKALSIEGMFAEIKAENESFRESLRVMGTALSNDALETLPNDLVEIDQRRTVALTQTTANAELTVLQQNFNEAVVGEDGNTVMDLRGAPELEDARKLHDVALRMLNENQFGDAKKTMIEAVAMAKEVVNRKVITDLRTDFSTAKEKWEIENNIGDMGTGRGSAGGGSKNFNQIRDAYIDNPSDAAISKTYMEARRARGL